jgi:hypothetical protein
MVSSVRSFVSWLDPGRNKAGFPSADQQKWEPVLRPIARQFMKSAHDLFAKPPTLWRIMRVRRSASGCGSKAGTK